MDDEHPARTRLHSMIRHTIVLYVLCAIATLVGHFTSMERAGNKLEQLKSFTPVYMIDLVRDALTDCVQAPPDAQQERAREPASGLSETRRAPPLSLERSPILQEPRPPCRVKPIRGDWPSVGHWAARLQNAGYWLGPFGLLVASADVAVHLLLAGSPVETLVAWTQLLIGFGVSIAIAQRLGTWLNDFWTAVFLACGTLFFGATTVWITVWIASVLFGVVQHFLPGPASSTIVAVATALAGQMCVLKVLFDYKKQEAVNSFADKAATFIIRWL